MSKSSRSSSERWSPRRGETHNEWMTQFHQGHRSTEFRQFPDAVDGSETAVEARRPRLSACRLAGRTRTQGTTERLDDVAEAMWS